ncbi:class I SAM-dependent methyltransferase [Curtobacterium sp. AB451]|uniref:class I SAM-dependent methyltransferase n=1 Tax=Curtobacterium sp. AB451 TaxID=3422306 RepID=UPI003D32D899
MHTHDDSAASASGSARTWWEARYAEHDGIWSGQVNAVLADVASSLPPGRALDLGCGEGGDVLWLAGQGWDVTGVDLSVTAITRGSRAAVAAGVEERTAFVAADLGAWTTAARFDLVTASFLQSWPVTIPRERILHRATGFVAPGGRLLVTAHAAPRAATCPRRCGRTASRRRPRTSRRCSSVPGGRSSPPSSDRAPRRRPRVRRTTSSTVWCSCDGSEPPGDGLVRVRPPAVPSWV